MDPIRISTPCWRAVVLAVLTSLCALPAMAQWQWIDSTGSRVFSDTPPPAGTPDKNILKRPGPARVPASAPEAPVGAVATTATTAAASTATAPKPTGLEMELEARKKQAEEAEKADQATGS